MFETFNLDYPLSYQNIIHKNKSSNAQNSESGRSLFDKYSIFNNLETDPNRNDQIELHSSNQSQLKQEISESNLRQLPKVANLNITSLCATSDSPPPATVHPISSNRTTPQDSISAQRLNQPEPENNLLREESARNTFNSSSVNLPIPNRLQQKKQYLRKQLKKIRRVPKKISLLFKKGFQDKHISKKRVENENIEETITVNSDMSNNEIVASAQRNDVTPVQRDDAVIENPHTETAQGRQHINSTYPPRPYLSCETIFNLNHNENSEEEIGNDNDSSQAQNTAGVIRTTNENREQNSTSTSNQLSIVNNSLSEFSQSNQEIFCNNENAYSNSSSSQNLIVTNHISLGASQQDNQEIMNNDSQLARFVNPIEPNNSTPMSDDSDANDIFQDARQNSSESLHVHFQILEASVSGNPENPENENSQVFAESSSFQNEQNLSEIQRLFNRAILSSRQNSRLYWMEFQEAVRRRRRRVNSIPSEGNQPNLDHLNFETNHIANFTEWLREHNARLTNLHRRANLETEGPSEYMDTNYEQYPHTLSNTQELDSRTLEDSLLSPTQNAAFSGTTNEVGNNTYRESNDNNTTEESNGRFSPLLHRYLERMNDNPNYQINYHWYKYHFQNFTYGELKHKWQELETQERLELKKKSIHFLKVLFTKHPGATEDQSSDYIGTNKMARSICKRNYDFWDTVFWGIEEDQKRKKYKSIKKEVNSMEAQSVSVEDFIRKSAKDLYAQYSPIVLKRYLYPDIEDVIELIKPLIPRLRLTLTDKYIQKHIFSVLKACKIFMLSEDETYYVNSWKCQAFKYYLREELATYPNHVCSCKTEPILTLEKLRYGFSKFLKQSSDCSNSTSTQEAEPSTSIMAKECAGADLQMETPKQKISSREEAGMLEDSEASDFPDNIFCGTHKKGRKRRMIAYCFSDFFDIAFYSDARELSRLAFEHAFPWKSLIPSKSVIIQGIMELIEFRNKLAFDDDDNTSKELIEKFVNGTVFDDLQHYELNNECSICLEKFGDLDKVLILMCNHTFHYTCLRAWFLSDTSCPLCRTESP